MTVFFIIGFIVSLLARVLLGAFSDKSSVIPKMLTPFTWITVVFGILMAIFIAIKIYNEVKKK